MATMLEFAGLRPITRADVSRKIAASWTTDPERAQAAALLERRASIRLQLAILKLAGSDLGEAGRLVDQGERDVIAWAVPDAVLEKVREADRRQYLQWLRG